MQRSFCQLQQHEFDSLIKVSKTLRTNGKAEEAIVIYLDVLAKVPRDSENAAYLCNLLNIVYRSIGEKALSLTYIYRAIELNKEIGSDRNLAKNYINLANYFLEEGQHEKSKNYLVLAGGLIEDKGDILNGYIFNSLGSYYNDQIDDKFLNIDTSTNYYLGALQVYKDNKAYHMMPGAYNNIAINYTLKNQNGFAKENYLRAIHLADSLNAPKDLINSYRNLGNLYMEEGDFEKALEVYNKSLALSSVENDPAYQVNIYANLVNANIALGQVDEAAILFRKFNQIRDSIYDAEKIQEVNELETKYETKLREQEILEQQSTINTKNFQKNIFLGLSILLVVLIVVAAWFFTQKQKYLKKLKNEEIANMKKEQDLKELNAMMHGQEEERNRIANDLHDRLGARLSSIKLLFQNDVDLQVSSSKLVAYIDEAITETREISHNLSTDMLTRFGLQTALKDTIRTIQNSNQIEADLAVYGMDSRWPLAIERNVFYVLLELLNNTIKHSGAKKLMVQISQIEEEVNIFYEDDGIGFDKMDTDSKGMGMRSMKARVNAIKADMRIETKAKAGFSAVISLQISDVGRTSSPSSLQSPA